MLIRHRVYLISAGLVAVLVAIGATAPNRFREVAEATLNTLGHYFGWFYLISTFVFVIFLLALAMSRYGKIRLGPQDCKPDYGVFSWLSMLLSAGFGVGLVLVLSAVFSSVTDNIPLAAMLAQILGNLDLAADSPYWWAVIFGANLGGNITPIGSASTLVAVTIIHKHGLELSFVDFVRAVIPFAALQLVLAAGYLLWVL